MVTTARFVELQTPFFVGDAWADFHTRVLSHVSDGALARSSFGLDSKHLEINSVRVVPRSSNRAASGTTNMVEQVRKCWW